MTVNITSSSPSALAASREGPALISVGRGECPAAPDGDWGSIDENTSVYGEFKTHSEQHPHYPTNSASTMQTRRMGSELSDFSEFETPEFSAVLKIYKTETLKCVGMVLAFVVALLHLYLYSAIFDTEVYEHAIPDIELRFFHHGWTAMLTIFLVEFCSMFLKIASTLRSPVLAMAVARKFEGNIGVLFGEYIVVAATYVIMGCNLMLVFKEDRTGRRVYGVRYMEWTVDVCGLVYLDCHILFGRPWQQFYVAMILSAGYMMFGLWSAIAPTWTLYWVFLAASWILFFIVCGILIRFLQLDPAPMQPFMAGVKPGILGFIISWWVLYGVVFMVAFGELISQESEQFLWTAMDVVMKLSHTVVLMAWRSSQSEIDAVVQKCRAEGQRFVAQLDKERAATTRDCMRLVVQLQSRTSALVEGETKPSQIHLQESAQTNEVSLQPSYGAKMTAEKSLSPADSTIEAMDASRRRSHCLKETFEIYRQEAYTCAVLCIAFAIALLHIYLYPELFDVEVARVEDVPDNELHSFHHGWTSMAVLFMIEAFAVSLKISCTLHQPLAALVLAQKYSGNLGALFAEYLIVGLTYVIMGYNFMPVFIEARTGRRVYAVRYMEWLVDACGLVSLDCHCLFDRSFTESRMTFLWTIAYVIFGLWSALSSTWLWYWIWLSLSWITFGLACCNLVHFLWIDPYPKEPFGNALVKPAILSFIIGWWILYGILFMLAFQAPDLMPQWLEQLLWTAMDVVMKLSHTVILIAWRETQWDMDTVVSRRKAVQERNAARKEVRMIRKNTRRLRTQVRGNIGGANWTLTPGLAVGTADVLRLQAETGQDLSAAQLRSMMSPTEYEELMRLEQLGIAQAELQEKWDWQTREQTFLKDGVHNIAYNPEDWAETLLGLRGRAGISRPCLIIIFVAIIVASINEIYPEIGSQLTISNSIHSLVGGSIMFLVVFRTQFAFSKWWSGRHAFGDIVLHSRTLAQQICAYVLDDEACQKMVKWIIAAVVATRCHLRSCSIEPNMLVGILRDSEIKDINKRSSSMPFYATWMIRSTLAKAVREGKFLPFQMAMEKAIWALEHSIGAGEDLLTPFPFIYVAHLRTFLFLYLLFLPFVLVKDLGRLMVLAVALASYLLIGLENTAVKLENPFGFDPNDLPLDLYCVEVSRELLDLLQLRAQPKDGLQPSLQPLRQKAPQMNYASQRTLEDDDE